MIYHQLHILNVVTDVEHVKKKILIYAYHALMNILFIIKKVKNAISIVQMKNIILKLMKKEIKNVLYVKNLVKNVSIQKIIVVLV